MQYCDDENEEKDEQLRMMRAWFFENFEDPAERTPYESAEGGYIWIWGGPYDAREELENEFSDSVPEDVINELVDELEGCCYEWAPTPSSDDYDDTELDWEITSSNQLKIFNDHLASIENLLDIKLDQKTEFNLLVMLHVHVIAAVEGYISSAFIHKVTNSDDLTIKLIKSDPELGKKNFSLKDIYLQHEKLKLIVASYLKSLIFHDMKKIKPMYKSVLDFEFGDIAWLFKAILLRHDCAHRAGYDKDENKIEITREDIKELISKCKVLVNEIDQSINKEET